MRLRAVTLAGLGAGVLSALLGGCVYYNGMYNANRLANSARKAERDGRTLEAGSLWGQVATKAESVMVRHPTSKYAGEASLLRGIALARLGQCDQAMGPLSHIPIAGKRSDLVEEAILANGRCQMAVGNYAAGAAAFSLLLDSKDAYRRREARFQHARVLRQSGQDQEALAALEGMDQPRARAERLLALAGAGRLPQALALTDSLLARGDTAQRWDSLVVILGEKNPRAASSLVERLRRLPGRRPELQAAMLLDDGTRLARIDTAAAARRFRQAMDIKISGDAPGRAALALVQLDIARASHPAELVSISDSLKKLASSFDLMAQEINRVGSMVSQVHAAATTMSDSSSGDLRLFLAAEAARDVLAAPRLAETLFRQILDRWPESPYTPKAILAAQRLNPGWADTAQTLLFERYWSSPYLATIRGEAAPEYRQLEDSLGAFAARLALTIPAAPPRRPPDRRPRPAAGGSRVPEPQ